MRRVLLALMLPLLAVAAPVPKHRPALGEFGDLTDPKTKCRCELEGGKTLTITMPADLPASEPNEAGTIRLLAHRIVEGDFVLTVRVAITSAAPGPSWLPEHQWAAGMGLTAAGDPGLGAAVLAAWGKNTRVVGLFRYSRRVPPSRLATGLQGSKGERTDLKGEGPLWLRLTRRGEKVTGEWSGDGKEWVKLSEETLPDLPRSVEVGPLVAKQVATEVTATLDQFEIESLDKDAKK